MANQQNEIEYYAPETLTWTCSGCGEVQTLQVESTVVAFIRGVVGRPLRIRTKCQNCAIHQRPGGAEEKRGGKTVDPGDLGRAVSKSGKVFRPNRGAPQ